MAGAHLHLHPFDQPDVEAAKVRTRRLARRQLTWMRKLAGVELVDVTDRDADEVVAELDLDSLRP